MKTKWFKYFRIKDGFSSRFAVAGHQGIVDLNNENLQIEIVKALYDQGVQNIELTDEGIKKYKPHLIISKPAAPKHKTIPQKKVKS